MAGKLLTFCHHRNVKRHPQTRDWFGDVFILAIWIVNQSPLMTRNGRSAALDSPLAYNSYNVVESIAAWWKAGHEITDLEDRGPHRMPGRVRLC
jgi:hypothetical protein